MKNHGKWLGVASKKESGMETLQYIYEGDPPLGPEWHITLIDEMYGEWGDIARLARTFTEMVEAETETNTTPKPVNPIEISSVKVERGWLTGAKDWLRKWLH